MKKQRLGLASVICPGQQEKEANMRGRMRIGLFLGAVLLFGCADQRSPPAIPVSDGGEEVRDQGAVENDLDQGKNGNQPDKGQLRDQGQMNSDLGQLDNGLEDDVRQADVKFDSEVMDISIDQGVREEDMGRVDVGQEDLGQVDSGNENFDGGSVDSGLINECLEGQCAVGLCVTGDYLMKPEIGTICTEVCIGVDEDQFCQEEFGNYNCCGLVNSDGRNVSFCLPERFCCRTQNLLVCNDKCCADDEICQEDTQECIQRCRQPSSVDCGNDLCCPDTYECVNEANCGYFCLCPECQICCQGETKWCEPGFECMAENQCEQACMPLGSEPCEEADDCYCAPGTMCTHGQPSCCERENPVPCEDKCCPPNNECLVCESSGETVCVPAGRDYCEETCTYCPAGSICKPNLLECDLNGNQEDFCMIDGSDPCEGECRVCGPGYSCVDEIDFPDLICGCFGDNPPTGCCPNDRPNMCEFGTCCPPNHRCEGFFLLCDGAECIREICVPNGHAFCGLQSNNPIIPIICGVNQKCFGSECIHQDSEICNNSQGNYYCEPGFVCVDAPARCCLHGSVGCDNICCFPGESCQRIPGRQGVCLGPGEEFCDLDGNNEPVICGPNWDCCYAQLVTCPGDGDDCYQIVNSIICMPEGSTCFIGCRAEQCGQRQRMACYCLGNASIIMNHCCPPGTTRAGNASYCPAGFEARKHCLFFNAPDCECWCPPGWLPGDPRFNCCRALANNLELVTCCPIGSPEERIGGCLNGLAIEPVPLENVPFAICGE